MILFQFGGQDIFSSLISFILLIVFFMFYPRLMIGQIMYKLDRTVTRLEGMSEKSKKFLIKEMGVKQTKELKESVDRFYEFFSISPVSLDTVGIIKKLDHMVREQKDRFDYFVNQTLPKASSDKKANIEMGFAGGISLYFVAKVVRHYVETVKKTKNFQIAMLIQMQLPMIEKIAESLEVGTKSLAKGEPIGDSLGPLVAADLIGKNKVTEIEEDIVMAKVSYDKRNIFVIKSKGPGGRLGYPGLAVKKIAAKNKITRFITVDAAAKMEGEKTGSVAEGTGVAMGGIGVEKSYIEDVAIANNIPIDSIIVKMSQEEAIMPMPKNVKNALPKVRESIKRSVARTKPGDNLLLVGVGNTSGVGDSGAWVEKVSKWVDAHHKKKAEEKEKNRSWFSFGKKKQPEEN